jgi:hypothetical protein
MPSNNTEVRGAERIALQRLANDEVRGIVFDETLLASGIQELPLRV